MATGRPRAQNKYSEQYILNASYDEIGEVLVVESVGSDGTNLQRTNASNLRVKFYSDATYSYFCFAAPGTSLSAASWMIKRVTSDGDVDYPSGSANFAFAATNLGTLQGYTYS